MRHLINLICTLCVLINLDAVALAADILAIRIGEHPEKTRIVLELSGSTAYQVAVNDGSKAVDIMLNGSKVQASKLQLPIHSGIIRKIERVRNQGGNAHIRLATMHPTSIITSFLLPAASPKPWRLVIDVRNVQQTPVARSVKTIPKPVIVIDPGHGGKDPGASGETKVFEKNIVLKASLELRDRLQATGKYKVLLTRTDDTFIPLEGRSRFAQKHNAALFISLHADAFPDKTASGMSVYTLSEKASDAEAAIIAADANATVAGVKLSKEDDEVTSILVDLIRRETMNQSARFATLLVQELSKHAKLKQKSHRSAGFIVLKSPDVPSVLIEMGYLSNPKEEWLLKQKSHRAQIISGIHDAVERYFLEKN